MDMGEGKENDIPPRRDEDHKENDHPLVFRNTANNDHDLTEMQRPRGDTRRDLTSYFESAGIRRPIFN